MRIYVSLDWKYGRRFHWLPRRCLNSFIVWAFWVFYF
jgi:hypothetical protein